MKTVFHNAVDSVQGGDKVCHWNAGLMPSVAE
jgi:hypothetical protein